MFWVYRILTGYWCAYEYLYWSLGSNYGVGFLPLRSAWSYGDLYPQAGHLHSQRGEHTGSAGTLQCSCIVEFVYLSLSSHYLLNFWLDAENAGLPEGKKGCWIFQEFIRTDDVVQVMDTCALPTNDSLFTLSNQNHYVFPEIHNWSKSFCLVLSCQCPGLECFWKAKQGRGSGDGDWRRIK